MLDLVGNPEERFSDDVSHILGGDQGQEVGTNIKEVGAEKGRAVNTSTKIRIEIGAEIRRRTEMKME